MSKRGRYERKVAAAPRKGVKAMLITVCVLAVLVLGVGTAAGLYVNSLLGGINHVEVEQIQYAAPAQKTDDVKVVSLADPIDRTAIAEDVTEPAEEKKNVEEKVENYLIVCKPVKKDGKVKVTDTMILCSMNRTTKTMTMSALDPEATVQVPAYKKYKGEEAALNTVYGLGATYCGGTAGAMTLMNQTLYDNFDIRVDRNFEFDLKVLARIVLRLDGIKIDIKKEEAAYLTEAMGKEIKEGQQTMDQKLADEFIAMWADEEAEGINALSGQKRMFEGIVQKVRTQYVGDLETIVKDIMPSITTSMKWHEFRQFLVSLLPMVRNLTIENGGTIPQA